MDSTNSAGWTCKQCTFVNNPVGDTRVCSMCNYDDTTALNKTGSFVTRFLVSGWQGIAATARFFGVGCLKSTTVGSANTAGWNCKQCTFLNHHGDETRVCSMCDWKEEMAASEKEEVPALTGEDSKVAALDDRKMGVATSASSVHDVLDLCDDEGKRRATVTATAKQQEQQSDVLTEDLTCDDANSAYWLGRELATTLNLSDWRRKSLRELRQEGKDRKIAQSLQRKAEKEERQKRARQKSIARSDEDLARTLQAIEEEDQAARRKAKAEEEVYDVLSEHRKGIQQLLRDKAQGLRIVSVDANPHSLVGTRLYNRFVEAWQQVADQTVTLAFHGTAEANIESICEHGLDPKRRSGQSMGPGEYFARKAITSVDYCKKGKKMLVVALLTDKTGLTLDNENYVVINKPEHQLPLFTVTFA